MFKLSYYSNDVDTYLIITAPIEDKTVVLYVTKIDATGLREDITDSFTNEDMAQIRTYTNKRICPTNFFSFEDVKSKLESMLITDQRIIH
jgi:hypothetical protein